MKYDTNPLNRQSEPSPVGRPPLPGDLTHSLQTLVVDNLPRFPRLIHTGVGDLGAADRAVGAAKTILLVKAVDAERLVRPGLRIPRISAISAGHCGNRQGRHLIGSMR